MFGSIVVGGGLYLLGRLLGCGRRRRLGMLCRVSALCWCDVWCLVSLVGVLCREYLMVLKCWGNFAVERSGERGNPAIWECLLFPIDSLFSEWITVIF